MISDDCLLWLGGILFVSSPLWGLTLFISVLLVPHSTRPCKFYTMNVHLVFSKDSRDLSCRFLEVSFFITPSPPEFFPATSSHLNPEFWSLSYQFSKTTVFCLGSPSQLCYLEIASRKKFRAINSSPLLFSFSLRWSWATCCSMSENVHKVFSNFIVTLGE